MRTQMDKEQSIMIWYSREQVIDEWERMNKEQRIFMNSQVT